MLSPPSARLTPLPWDGGSPPAGWFPHREPNEVVAPVLVLIDIRAMSPERTAALEALLSAEEQERLERLQRGEDRQRFALGRGGLRLLLAEQLHRDPRELVLRAGPRGKPELVSEEATGSGPGEPPPWFNVSHSGDLILLGFHPRRPVGVDVERERSGLDWRPIGRRSLTTDTMERIEALPPGERLPAFLQAWCHLEACLKAPGLGLGEAPPPGLNLWDVAVPPGYAGAAAVLEVLDGSGGTLLSRNRPAGAGRATR